MILPVCVCLAACLAVTASNHEGLTARAATYEADQTRDQNNDWERHVEGENRYEGGGGDADHHLVLQRPPADADHRFEHDRQHRRLEPEEQTLDDADVAQCGVDGKRGSERDVICACKENAAENSELPEMTVRELDRQLT